MKRLFLAAVIASCVAAALARKAAPDESELDRALTAISVDTLRGNLSFLASDVLEGRYTPSRGLDTAAEFIASRFRAAGLASGSGADYFQVADLTQQVKKIAERRGQPPPVSVIARNVVALLPGSDPNLKNTYVVLSAHYDHLGTLKTSIGLTKDKSAKNGDEIFNGANDDGSGTVSVIEIATAFAKMPQRPRRSILFVTFCGEELGLLGSRYYVQHPLFPLAQTVADINLEQVGRSDGEFGKDHATLTGYDFTDLSSSFEKAAATVGMTMVKTKETDPYFRASDNFSFAAVGIPDVTLATSYEFPDYHGLKDEWKKIDFATMAKVDRLAALVLWSLAKQSTTCPLEREQSEDRILPPSWNAGQRHCSPLISPRLPHVVIEVWLRSSCSLWIYTVRSAKMTSQYACQNR